MKISYGHTRAEKTKSIEEKIKSVEKYRESVEKLIILKNIFVKKNYKMENFTFQELYEAYLDCIKNKKSSKDYLEYDLKYKKTDLIKLVAPWIYVVK